MNVPRGTLSTPPRPTPTSESLSTGLAELAHPLRSEARVLDRLSRLVELVEDWSSRLNLTGHRTSAAIVRDLILEAAALERALPEAPRIADIGSGAGFPGLPLAILRPDARLTLVESRERRHHFQRFAIRELALENVEALRGRAERMPAPAHDLAIAQAAAKPADALPLLVRWLRPGGLAVIAGPAEAPQPGIVAGIRASRIVPYQVPLGGRRRTLWVGVFDPSQDAGPG